jgi:hypothetical protein
MSGSAGRTPFDYAAVAERRRQAFERMMAGVPGLVIIAARGDREPLIDYLNSGPQLSEDDASCLARLIEKDGWLLEPKKPRNGRPPGSVTPKTLATACASYLVRIAKRSWRKRHDCKRISTKGPNKAPIESWIKYAIERVETKIPQVRGKIDEDDVKSGSNCKSSVDAVEYVCDHLPEAKREIIELALK